MNTTPRYLDISSIKTNRIDVKEGDLTFGQRIQLGKIFEQELSESQTFDRVFQTLYDGIVDPEDFLEAIPLFKEIVAGLQHWIETEQKLLHYEPSTEELKAGIKDLSSKIGHWGTLNALSKAYAKDPDEILQWKYGKIFGIIYTDFEENEFQRRLQKIYNSKI